MNDCSACLHDFRAAELTRFAARHGFQYVLVNPSPGVSFSGELDALTAHWCAFSQASLSASYACWLVLNWPSPCLLALSLCTVLNWPSPCLLALSLW